MSEQQGPETRFDPSGNTEAFQAFARNTVPPPVAAGRKPQLGVIIGAIAAVIVVVAIVIVVIAR